MLEDLSVLVPTLGRPTLLDCIRSILAGTVLPVRMIVVDQGENAEVAAWLEEMRTTGIDVDHVRTAPAGTAAATNLGLARLRTRFVAVTHDDCVVSSDWLATLHARLLNHPNSIVTGMVTPEIAGQTPSVITFDTEVVYTRPLLGRDPLFPANMGFARATAERIGPFLEDSRVRYAEDAEWSYRALRLGCAIVYAPEVAVEHRDWRDADSLSRTYGRYARSQGGFYGIYLRRGDPFIALRAGLDLLRGPWILARAAFARDEVLAIIGRAYLSQLVPGILEGLRRGER